MNCVKARLLGLSLAMIVGQLPATNRYFHNLTNTSANGRFRVEATSPDNTTGPCQRRFQSLFQYRLLKKGKSGEVWSRRQLIGADNERPVEGPPMAIYVSDDGWVVLRTADLDSASSEIIAVDIAGQDRLRVRILEKLLPKT